MCARACLRVVAPIARTRMPSSGVAGLAPCMCSDPCGTHGPGARNSWLSARGLKITNVPKVGPAEVVDRWWGHTRDVCGSDDRIGEALGRVTDFHTRALTVISTNSGLVPSGHTIPIESSHQIHQGCDPKLEPKFQ